MTKLAEKNTPSALENIAMIRAIGGEGGWVPLNKPPTTLTIDQIKSILGPRRGRSTATLPPLQVDSEEQHRFLPRSSVATAGWSSFWGRAVAALGFAVAVVWVYRWRKRAVGKVAALILLAGGMTGCSRPAEPRPALEASIPHNLLVHKAKMHWLPIHLTIRNIGNVPLRLDKVEGGCSCRKVDGASLPRSLEPGNAITLPVELQARPVYGPQRHEFSVVTDRGIINVETTLIALADHVAELDAPANNTLIDGGAWNFEFTHRSIRAVGQTPTATRLVAPPGFRALELRRTRGKTLNLAELDAEDVTYRIELLNEALGAFKEELKIVDDQGNSLLDVPIAWNRVPFLSSSPSPVMLGAHPVRVFLRCPDETVELLQIVAFTPGVIAVVTSPREVSIRLADDAPAVFMGTVEITTSAKDRPRLRVPVIRYSTPAPPGPRQSSTS